MVQVDFSWNNKLPACQCVLFGRGEFRSRIIREILRGTGAADLITVTQIEDMFATLRSVEPDVLLIEASEPIATVAGFIQTIRREQNQKVATISIIAMIFEANDSILARLRDCGVSEMVTMPLSRQTLLVAISDVFHKPRSFLRFANYIGPDRRRESRKDYTGPKRREIDRIAKKFAADSARVIDQAAMLHRADVEMAAFLCDTSVEQMEKMMESDSGFSSFVSSNDEDDACLTGNGTWLDDAEIEVEFPKPVDIVQEDETGAMTQDELAALLKRPKN